VYKITSLSYSSLIIYSGIVGFKNFIFQHTYMLYIFKIFANNSEIFFLFACSITECNYEYLLLDVNCNLVDFLFYSF